MPQGVYVRIKKQIGPNKGKGKAAAWLHAHVGHAGTGCLIWPFAIDDKGYGMLGHNGGHYKAHRFMCIFVRGEPPSRLHEAAHSCGNGNKGCVHPRHVSWKTGSQNQLDSVLHGTGKKPGGPRRKLTAAMVAKIKTLKGKKTQRAVGAMFGVHAETIGKVWRGHAHARPYADFNRRFPPDVRAAKARRAKQMRDAGSTYDEIAAELDVSRVTARHFVEDATTSHR